MKLSKEQIFGMYLGQKVTFQIMGETLIGYLTEVARDHVHIKSLGNGIKTTDNIKAFSFKVSIDHCKLILRIYDDMTEEECKYFATTTYANKYYNGVSISQFLNFTIEQIEYLISIGIDVFGAIEKGYAVRKIKS